MRKPYASLLVVGLAACLTPAGPTAGQEPEAVQPEDLLERHSTVAATLEDVSAERIREYLTRLVGFGTRHTLSDTLSDSRGIGAARRYIYDTFQEFSRACGGCLEVSYDPHEVVFTEHPDRPTVRVVNVLARLPGRTDPNRVVVVTAHYDSCICSVDDTDARSDAPGADDDGSGTAAVIELARVFSQRFPEGLDATVIFAPVAGEEQGLHGSTGLAEELASDTTLVVGAAITNDIIGNIHGASGRVDSTHVRVFSGEPDNGPSRQLARYARVIGEIYVPDFQVTRVDRLDRIHRGGDHIPFWAQGLPAIRFSEAIENYLHQHRPEDRIEFVHFPYIQSVARINAATIAELAMAPRPPIELDMDRLSEQGGNDWRLTWSPVPAPDLAGYEITIRSTTAPLPEQVIAVGNVSTYLLENTSVDNLWIGIRAVDRDGHRSLVRSFHDVQRLPPALSGS